MNQKQLTLSVVCLCLAAAAAPIMAETAPAPVTTGLKGIAHFGYELGGDTLVDVSYTDGSSSTIKAGDGLVLAGGVAYLFDPQFSVQTTIGWKQHSIKKASNGDADFTRFPLEVLGRYTIEQFRLAAGLSHHLNPKLNTSGAVDTPSVSFKNATGTVMQFDYVTEMGLTWGLRVSSISYTPDKGGKSIAGNSFGLHLSGQF